jgi:hypothetical protein
MDPNTPITGTSALDHVLAIVGALVPLLSALASFVNWKVRQVTAAGQEPSKALLATGSILNVASVNLDKGVQFAQMARGKPVAHTQAAPAPVPAVPAAVESPKPE